MVVVVLIGKYILWRPSIIKCYNNTFRSILIHYAVKVSFFPLFSPSHTFLSTQNGKRKEKKRRERKKVLEISIAFNRYPHGIKLLQQMRYCRYCVQHCKGKFKQYSTLKVRIFKLMVIWMISWSFNQPFPAQTYFRHSLGSPTSSKFHVFSFFLLKYEDEFVC